jgi:hypothetical protein
MEGRYRIRHQLGCAARKVREQFFTFSPSGLKDVGGVANPVGSEQCENSGKVEIGHIGFNPRASQNSGERW